MLCPSCDCALPESQLGRCPFCGASTTVASAAPAAGAGRRRDAPRSRSSPLHQCGVWPAVRLSGPPQTPPIETPPLARPFPSAHTVPSDPVDALSLALQVVVDEFGIDLACSDPPWLQNLLADYSPHTRALNRVAALAAREGVPGWLRAARPEEIDAVVSGAVSRLASTMAIDRGAAHAAVTAWALALRSIRQP